MISAAEIRRWLCHPSPERFRDFFTVNLSDWRINQSIKQSIKFYWYSPYLQITIWISCWVLQMKKDKLRKMSRPHYGIIFRISCLKTSSIIYCCVLGAAWNKDKMLFLCTWADHFCVKKVCMLCLLFILITLLKITMKYCTTDFRPGFHRSKALLFSTVSREQNKNNSTDQTSFWGELPFKQHGRSTGKWQLVLSLKTLFWKDHFVENWSWCRFVSAVKYWKGNYCLEGVSENAVVSFAKQRERASSHSL